jgi:hypothetical protein
MLTLVWTVCILVVMQRPGVILSNKVLFIGKKMLLDVTSS